MLLFILGPVMFMDVKFDNDLGWRESRLVILQFHECYVAVLVEVPCGQKRHYHKHSKFKIWFPSVPFVKRASRDKKRLFLKHLSLRNL
jgi:hypothetical protein